MRRILTGFAVAVTVTAITTLASAGNQDLADQVAQELRASGQMSGYRIGVKCQNGTVWLRGSVTSEEQMNAALKLAFHTQGVARVVNELSVTPEPAAQPAPREASQASSESHGTQAASAIRNPLRGQGSASASAKDQRQPQKDGLVKRLGTAIVGNGPDPKPAAHAQRVPSSYRAAPAEQTSAQMEEVPQPMAVPQQARPMGTNYAATQACPRGPRAPNGAPLPMYTSAAGGAGVAPARYDQPCLPNYAWPSYAAYPNYAAVTYPKQYSPTAWPYIGPFYPYPQVPLGWRKVTLEWDDGWWFLDFKDQPASCWHH
jgi:hypothetical protein